MRLLGKETWDQYIKELRLTPSNAGAGGKYNMAKSYGNNQ